MLSSALRVLPLLLLTLSVGCTTTPVTVAEEFKGVGETVHSPIDFDIHLLFKAATDAVQKHDFRVIKADKPGGLILTDYKVTETSRLQGPVAAQRVRIKITSTGKDYELFIQAITLDRKGEDWKRKDDDTALAVAIGRSFYAEADRIFQQQRNNP